MPDITMTRQTSLRGVPLQNAVNAMVQAMGRRSPFNMVPIQTNWPSATRLTFSSPGHVSGAIDIVDGSPSTLTAQVTFLSALARNYRGQVESAMVEESQRAMPIVGASAPTQTQTQAPAQTQAPSTGGSSSGSSWTQWTTASNILGDIFGGSAAILDQYNQQMGYSAAQEAVQVATAEVAASASKGQSGKIVSAAPAPSIVGSQQPVVPVSFVMPTWGWVALGLGGVGMLALIIYTGVTKHG